MKIDSKSEKIVIIVDPACYPKNGHNIDSCLRFSEKELNNNNSDLIFYISGNPKKIKEKGLNAETIPKIYPQLYLDSFDNKCFNFLYKIIYKLGNMILGNFIDHFISFTVKKNVKRIFKKAENYKETLIFFPSCDFYYAKSVLEKLEEDKKNNIELRLRFIGVMEHACIKTKKSENKLFNSIKNSRSKNIKITAETNKYGNFLSNIIGVETKTEPYPIKIKTTSTTKSKQKYTQNSPMKIILLGKARVDKGNLDLPLFLDISLRELGMNAIFYTTLFEKTNRYKKIERKIKSYPNVVMIEKPLPEKEFRQLITDSDVVLMPYDIKTYWYRGSAIFFDSIEKGKLIYARNGCAFADDMSEIGAIKTFHNIQSFTNSIALLLHKGPTYLAEVAERNMKAYCSWYEKNENILLTPSLSREK